jgi:glutamate racemase
MIGIFDSGIGGLTVVRELLKQAPDASFIYLGDTARTPYGNKSPETVIRYALEDARFLLAHGASSIVVACNTASALASAALREAFPTVPVFEVITPAVEDAISVTKGRVGVIGTRATVTSGIYEKRLREKKEIEVVAAACPLLVPLVEEGWLDDSETKRIIRRYLSPLKQRNVDTLILGCTHYPLLAPLIQHAIGRRVKLIDSGASVVRRVLEHKARSTEHGALNTEHGAKTEKYFLTDLSARSGEIARKWLGRDIRFEKAELEIS